MKLSSICLEAIEKVKKEKDVETAKGLMRLDESFSVIEIEGKRGLTPSSISKDLKDLLMGF